MFECNVKQYSQYRHFQSDFRFFFIISFNSKFSAAMTFFRFNLNLFPPLSLSLSLSIHLYNLLCNNKLYMESFFSYLSLRCNLNVWEILYYYCVANHCKCVVPILYISSTHSSEHYPALNSLVFFLFFEKLPLFFVLKCWNIAFYITSN